MTILLTGASSFTGLWFAQALAAAGHVVVAPLRRADIDAYAGVRRRRVEALAAVAEIVWAAPLGSDALLATIAARRDWSLLALHAAQVDGYRRADFDALAALHHNTAGLAPLLAAFARHGGRAVISTGSVFEADEGIGTPPLNAFNPYGLAKTLTAQVQRFAAHHAGLAHAKFVIPNPFGMLEEARFCQYLFRTWLAGGTAGCDTPDYVRDNIPVDLLALAYADYAAQILAGTAGERASPSGYAETVGAFAHRVAAEARPRLGLACELAWPAQSDVSEPPIRINAEPTLDRFPNWLESRFWDDYVAFQSVTLAGVTVAA